MRPGNLAQPEFNQNSEASLKISDRLTADYADPSRQFAAGSMNCDKIVFFYKIYNLDTTPYSERSGATSFRKRN
jgi:hypothetical protein